MYRDSIVNKFRGVVRTLNKTNPDFQNIQPWARRAMVEEMILFMIAHRNDPDIVHGVEAA